MTAEQEKELRNLFKEIAKDLPKFDDGRTDYTNAKKAIVLSILVKHQEEILLLKRSDNVGTYKGLWSGLGGYYDEDVDLLDKINEELREEIGFSAECKTITGEFLVRKDNDLDTEWIIVPVVIELNQKPEIILDWEHQEYKWISPNELNNYETINNFKENFALIIK